MVVVVPLYFELKLIKHKGSASLSDVGLLHNEHAHTRQEDKAVRGIEVPEPWLQCLALGLGKNEPASQSGQIDCVPTFLFTIKIVSKIS